MGTLLGVHPIVPFKKINRWPWHFCMTKPTRTPATWFLGNGWDGCSRLGKRFFWGRFAAVSFFDTQLRHTLVGVPKNLQEMMPFFGLSFVGFFQRWCLDNPREGGQFRSFSCLETEDCFIIFFGSTLSRLGCYYFFWGVMVDTWRIGPHLVVRITPVYKPFRPFGRATTRVRRLANHGCYYTY